MKPAGFVAFLVVALQAAGSVRGAEPAATGATDPRVRDVVYEERTVIAVAVHRGVVTEIDLEPSESIAFAASGFGSECHAKEDKASWCIAALSGQHVLFVKPRSNANGDNNLQVVTKGGRSYSFVLQLLGRSDAREAVHRLAVHLPKPPPPTAPAVATTWLPPIPLPSTAQPGADRAGVAPTVVNAAYSAAVGKGSDDIVPDLVFDDARFTYLRFPGNRQIPAVFERGPDGGETMVNAEMQGDLLRVDRVVREFYLRMGNQAVRIWNDAFDIDGRPPVGATTVPGLERVIRGGAAREPGGQQ